jgi:UDP-3-O-[3-hydroxymyristoyl] glucosamine N-acyltransferase
VPATVQQLAALIQGAVHGNPDLTVRAARPLAEAGPDDVSFLDSERALRQLKQCRAGVLVLAGNMIPRLDKFPPPAGHSFTLIEVAEPFSAFITIAQHLLGPTRRHPPGVSPQASLHPSVQLGPDCHVGPFAVVGEGTVMGARCIIHPGVVIGRDCRLGDDVTLYPNAVLYDGVILGNRITLHAGAVLGADGFGYRFVHGRHVKIPQLGCVEVSDDVEIGAGATIDRGAFQPTRIGEGTKIDNLVMIAHNCQIGRHNLLCSQVGIAGSCSTGDYVVLAGQVGVADHANIGANSVVGAHSGVPSDVPPGSRIFGYPARAERESRRILASLPRLPELCKDVRRIKKQLGIEESA